MYKKDQGFDCIIDIKMANSKHKNLYVRSICQKTFQSGPPPLPIADSKIFDKGFRFQLFSLSLVLIKGSL